MEQPVIFAELTGNDKLAEQMKSDLCRKMHKRKDVARNNNCDMVKTAINLAQ